MTPEKAKTEFERRCLSLPSLDSIEPHLIEVPEDILCSDMFEVLNHYKAKGWLVQLTHTGMGFWFTSPTSYEKQIVEAHEQRAHELNLEKTQHDQRLCEIQEEKERNLKLLFERQAKIKRGEHPY